MQICSLSSEGGLKKKHRKSFILTHTAFNTSIAKFDKTIETPTIKAQINKSHTQIPKVAETPKVQKAILKKANPAIINKIKKGGLSGLSINQFLNKKEGEEDEQEITAATGKSRSEFNKEQLNPLWLEYAKTIEKKRKNISFPSFLRTIPKN